jgi:HTH-type transcriptional regulator / antitoxin HigA
VAAKTLDLTKYTNLLAKAHPIVIETEEENDRVLALIQRLSRKRNRSLEEQELLKLLVRLVEDFEEQHYKLKDATPDQVLRELLRARDMKPKDLWGVFGSKGITSEVLRGKRGISKDKAKVLSAMFHVPVELLI